MKRLRIKKFRLAEAFALVVLAVGMLVATTSDMTRARAVEIPSNLEASPAAAVIMAVVCMGLAVWLLRDAIRVQT